MKIKGNNKANKDMSNPAKDAPGKADAAVITDITPDKSTLIKGIAIILLMWHHLFSCGNFSDWISPIDGIDFIVGESGLICLAIFLFCSGYGLYKSYICKASVRKTYVPEKAVSTLIPYWIIMLITIGVLLILGKFEPKYIPLNILAWVHSEILYVDFSWYIKLYLLLLLTIPLVRLIEKKWKKNIIIDILIYIAVPFVIYFIFRDYCNEETFTGFIPSIISSILFLLSWFPMFASGFLFAKYDIYSKILRYSKRLPRAIVIFLSFLIAGNVIYIRFLYHYECFSDLIYAPLFIVSCLLIYDNVKFKSRYVMPYLGDKSLYYWLLSGLFFGNSIELLPAITWPRIPIFILIWSLLVLTPLVFVCSWLSDKITGLILRKKK